MRTGVWWGLPIALLVFAAWAIPATREMTPEFKALLQDIESRRVTGGHPLEFLHNFYRVPLNFLLRFGPWSVLFALTLVHLPLRRWCASPVGPTVLWTLMILGVFVIPASTRDDYIVPAYPTAAIVAAWYLVVVQAKFRRQVVWGAVVVALLLCTALVVNDFTIKPQLRDRLSDNTLDFARAIRREIGDTDRVVFIDTGYNTLQAYMGMNQAGKTPTGEALASAVWIVKPVAEAPADDDAEAVIVSKPLPFVINRKKPGILGLYRVR